MSDNEPNAGHFAKWKTLKQAVSDVLKTIGLNGSKLSAELNSLDKIAYEVNGRIVMTGCIDAATMAMTCEGTLIQKLMIVQSTAQALMNAISKYDDIHDWRDVNFDPNERGANINKAVTVEVLEKELNTLSIKANIKKKQGAVDALKDAIKASLS